MGIICHNAVIVTGHESSASHFDSVWHLAVDLFGPLATKIFASPYNGYMSFFVAPDGSKESWPESDEYDRKREELFAMIDSFKFEDGSNSITYIDVSYGENYGEESVLIRQTNISSGQKQRPEMNYIRQLQLCSCWNGEFEKCKFYEKPLSPKWGCLHRVEGDNGARHWLCLCCGKDIGDE